MIRREKMQALILARRHSGEADRWLTLFTRDHGLLHVLAKGVRKIPSRRGGHVEPLTRVLAIVTGAAGHFFLAGVEPQDTYEELRTDARTLRRAQHLGSLVVQLFAEEEPHETLFDALNHAWQILPSLPLHRQEVLETAVAAHALQLAGVLPDLSACQVCGLLRPHDAIVLESRQGGWHCLGCHHSLAGTQASLSPRLLQALRFIVRYPEKALQLKVTPDESGQLANTMREYCQGVMAVAR